MSCFSAAQQNFLNTVNYNQFWGLQPLNKLANTVLMHLYLHSFNAIVWYMNQELLLMRHEILLGNGKVRVKSETFWDERHD